jgi:AI-2 transport protein TqsA
LKLPFKAPRAPSVPPEIQGGSVALRNAGVFLAVVAGGAAVKYFQGIITPLVIAIFLLLLIDGLSRTAARRLPFLPVWLRSLAGAIITIGGFAAVVGICAHYARDFGVQLLALQPKIDGLLDQATSALQLPPITVHEFFRGQDMTGKFGHLFGVARRILVEAGTVMIYLGFLLASRRAFGQKAARIFAHGGGDYAERIFERVRDATETYIGIQTFKAAAVAACGWAIMSLVGLQNPVFLALIIFMTAYVPIVGGVGGVALPALLALAQFDTPLQAIILVAALGGVSFIIESVILPKLQSDRLNLDPVFILLALGFWGTMLGLPGALLSTPLTVMVMAIAAEFEGARWLALLLSKSGELAIRPADAPN